MPTIIQKRGWSVRINYAPSSGRKGSFVAFSEDGLEHTWFKTRKEARTFAQKFTPSYGAFPVRATLTLKVEDR